jgi:hypothetical protein
MPRMNGTDLSGHLMEERPGIKVLVSGADMAEIVSKNANMPFLPKPFNGQTLTARVRKILDPSSSGQQSALNQPNRAIEPPSCFLLTDPTPLNGLSFQPAGENCGLLLIPLGQLAALRHAGLERYSRLALGLGIRNA